MKRIGILGGTFDPPHIGHLLIAEAVRDALLLDKIWFIPTYSPPHKNKRVTSAKHRVHMLELAISNHPDFEINTIEIKRSGTSFTFDTMQDLKNKYADQDFYFIIGGDMVEHLPKWYKIDDLLNLVSFVGVNRPGFTVDSPYPLIHVEVPAIDISSTTIRERLASNKTITYLLPKLVYDYIKEHGLYEH